MHMNDYCKITAPYSRLSVGDEDSIQKVLSSDNTWACLIFILSVGYGINSWIFRERGIVFRRRVVYNVACIDIAFKVYLCPNMS